MARLSTALAALGESLMKFGSVRDGCDKLFIYSHSFADGRLVLFSPLENEYYLDCIDLLEAQYGTGDDDYSPFPQYRQLIKEFKYE